VTSEEAIKILTPDSEEHFEASVQKLEEAERLGVEALKRLQKCRKAGYKFYCQLMPGETKE